MKKMAVIAVIAAIAVLNLWLMGLNIILCLALVGFGFCVAAFGDFSSKKEPKQTISLTKAARQQRELAKA